MKRLIFLAAFLMLAACKPEVYLGPLNSPVGNWDGIKGEYYFNGEKVGELDSCSFSAISFYKQGFCCIEGVKGAFPFIYDHENGDLQIDSTLWSVTTLTGEGMVMKFADRIYPEPGPADSIDVNGIALPAEFKGMKIESDSNGYFYLNASGQTVYCNFKGTANPDGAPSIDFWYDSSTNHFIPLVVEVEKK